GVATDRTPRPHQDLKRSSGSPAPRAEGLDPRLGAGPRQAIRHAGAHGAPGATLDPDRKPPLGIARSLGERLGPRSDHVRHAHGVGPVPVVPPDAIATVD